MINHPTRTFICSVPFTSVEEITEMRKELTKKYGILRLRGRHSNRKLVLGNQWRRNTQNDIPWKLAERVSFYIHDNNPHYRMIQSNGINSLKY
jgi:hypothetical protein